MSVRRRWIVIPFVFVVTALLVATFVSSSRKHPIHAARTNLMIASERYPKFTLAQRMAVLSELQSERHPHWSDLSLTELAQRLTAFLMSSPGSTQSPLAPFGGNLTAISVPSGNVMGLTRQPNCSLTLEWAGYSLTLPTVSYTVAGTTANYDQLLHNAAGLTTKGGSWPAGCGDPTLGITARTAVPFGLINGNMLTGAGVGYDSMVGAPVIWTGVGSLSGGTNVAVDTIPLSGSSPVAAAAADLNGDGNTDLVVLTEAATTGGSATIAVLLGNPDGSLQTPVIYTLPGGTGLGAVIDDFNGDGKLDIVATSSTMGSMPGQYTYELSFLAGKGDGTFQAPQSTVLTPPAGVFTNPYFGLISADLLGNRKKDLVTSAGVELMGNGDGTFTQSATVAFSSPVATSEWGPNVVAGDFNKDGKLDLAFDDGQLISIYLGKGDGTFTAGNSYATISNIGYLNPVDLDGDGNIDLYSGIARGGLFGGDKFEYGQAYALMGNGDGTFQGAPELPFVFTGTNLADLNGDKVLDGVGVNATAGSSNVSMTSYLGTGKGTFTTGHTLQISPATIQGTSYSFSSLDSFGLGDVTGDGKTDLVFLPAGFNGPGGEAGYFLAMGNGDGSFNTPVFIAAPTFAPSGDFDQYEYLQGLFVADVNGDGKADVIYSYSVDVYQTGVYEQGIAVQLSNGDGTFQAPQVIQTYSSTTPPTNGPPFVVQLGDATGNGKLDLFTDALNSSTGVFTLQFYLGKGDGTFTLGTPPPVANNVGQPSFGSVLGQIVLADMNGDGKPDLVTLGTSSSGSSELAISLGNGDGTFKTPTITTFTGGSSLGYGLAAADFNGDGKIDVAVTGFNPPFDTGIFLGNGDGTVQTFTTAGGAVEPAQAIDLFVYGPSLAVKMNGGSGLSDLIAGGAVLINQASTAPTLIPTTTAVSASSTSITTGQNVTFTATVTASSTPSGTVTFYDGTTALGTGTLNGSGVATYSTSSLGVGSHSITATYAGNSTFAGSTSSATTVTVTAPVLIATSTKLTASATTANAGASVTFNVTVTPASGSGTPTGTVTFMDGTTTLAMMSLSGGAVSYSTSSLAVGAHSITAVYGGDTNYSGSTSSAVTVTVQALVPSFTLGASPTSGSVAAGSSAQTTISVTPVNGFNLQVSFACSGLSNGVTCSFNPQTVTPNGTATANTMLTIGTTSQSAQLARPASGPLHRSARGAATLAFLAAGALWFFRRRKGPRWTLWIVTATISISAVLAGCGSGSKSAGQLQSANYTITITATAGSQSQTATYALTVTQ
jgi:hypothetical protein